MQHLDEGTIHAWLDGALPADEAAGVEQHARECTECAALVADARGVIAGVARIVSALDDVPGGVVPQRRPASERRSMWRTLRLTPLRAALAATLLVAAAGLEVIRHAPRDAMQPPHTAAPAAAPLAVDGNAPLPSAKPTSEKTTMKALDRAPAPAPVAMPTVAAPPVLAEMKSATPKSVEVRLDSVRRDTSFRARDVVASSPAADSISRTAVNVEAASRRAQQVVVTSTAAAARAVSGAVGDSARARPNDTQVRATADRVIVRPFRIMLTSADNRPLVFPGCYQLVRDTTSLARLPERFSLESDTAASALRNIVRALTADGRRDSVVPGATWQVTSGFSAGVLIVSDGAIVPTFSRREAAPSLRPDVARGSNGRVNRIDCR
jgi:hypothetical protein